MVTKHAVPDPPFKPHGGGDHTAFRPHGPSPVKRPTLNAIDTTLPPRRSPVARPLPLANSALPSNGPRGGRRPDPLRPTYLKISHVEPPLRSACSFDTSRHGPMQLSPARERTRPVPPRNRLDTPPVGLKPTLSMTNMQSGQFAPPRHDRPPLDTPVSARFPHRYHPPELHFDIPLRSSLQSATTGSSSLEPASGTERSSILTNTSSITDLTPDTAEEPVGGMSVDDAIDMYLDGFSDDSSPSLELADSPEPPNFLESPEPPSRATESPSTPEEEPKPGRPPSPKDPESPGGPTGSSRLENQSHAEDHCPTGKPPPPPMEPKVTVPEVLSVGVPPPLSAATKLRDQYGFKKETTYVTLAQYNKWNEPYSRYVGYRRQKWVELLKDSGLEHKDTLTFPPRSGKVKRYIRKGIPPEYRGAAWFWYTGGHEHLQRNPGLYRKLVEQAVHAPMNDDKEHIERDLHRTFPDNIHYKPDSSSETTTGAAAGSSNLKYAPDAQETPIIQSLRRVLYAFSVHNPKIGYTQSLNFITGLLLLFLPEEKAFWMLHIITSTYLPGTHEVSLEGANADLWILMVALKDALPPVYTKVASPTPTTPRSKPPAINTTTRLPDITLGLTNWLMSMFIGSLPLETTLRVWDILFYEGSRTFFRVALAIFRLSQRDILAVSDPMEIFQIVQTAPKKMIDASALADECFVRRFQFSQARIESLRAARRQAIREDKERVSFLARPGNFSADSDRRPSTSSNNNTQAGAWRTWKNHTFR
ncbi:GTPase activating protein [Coccidioides immitis RS]|uniref:GTPase activating protein n=1 Tax=Coccidioides immitis (strain RS) TaxID=246410 RepID=J3KBE9_COCIM|nr:GTPase activating protein [Coccidioides immitis RS]EAS32438.3 GTPase activating protein [Coccidioides immitis RS]